LPARASEPAAATAASSRPSVAFTVREHRGRFDSIEAVLRSLTQMVGQVLQRLPDQPRG
jgi:hypothetical protein